MNENINKNNDSSVVVFQPNKFGNSSKNNSHNLVVIVDSSQGSDFGNTECSEDKSKTSLSKTNMVGVHFVISSPEGPPISPLNPPSQSWIATTTSMTTYSLSSASLVEFSAQYSLPSAATTSHKSHVPLETCSAATKDSVKNSAYTIKDKATIVLRSSRNSIS